MLLEIIRKGETQMYCLKCGSQMAEGSKFCITCGARLENGESVQEAAAQVAVVNAGGAAVLEEAAQPAQSVQSAPKPEPPQPAQQPAPPQPVQQQPAQSTQVSQPKPVQSSFTQPTQQKPAQPAQPAQVAQPIQQSNANVQQQAVPQPAAAYQKPEKVNPLPVWKYIGIFLIMGIPILNIIMVFVWAFGTSFNRNTKNYARAVLITFLIFLVLTIVGYFTIWASIQSILNNYIPSGGIQIIN